MNETGIKDIVIKEIRELAEKNHVNALILFGSRARGILNVPAISTLQ